MDICVPPYSPDLSPCDFFLLPKLKNYLKGRHLGSIKNKNIREILCKFWVKFENFKQTMSNYSVNFKKILENKIFKEFFGKFQGIFFLKFI